MIQHVASSDLEFNSTSTVRREAFESPTSLVLRSYTAPQMKRLIQSSPDWECVDTYDFGYDITDPITVDATSEDVVYVLKRKRSK